MVPESFASPAESAAPAVARVWPGLGAAAALLLLYLAAGVWDHGLWSPTEPAFGGVVWNMARGAGLFVPRVNEMAYLEKPPLSYWLALPGVKAFGLSAAALRLPSALLVLAALAALHLVARRLYDPFAAAVAALAAGTMPSVWLVAHRATTDSAALFFAFLAWAVFLDGLRDEPPARTGGRGREPLLAAIVAVSFLVKNLFVPYVVLVPVGATLVALGRFRSLAKLGAWFALFLALVAAPWAYVLHAEGGWTFVRVALLDNTVGRFLDLGQAARIDGTLLDDATTVNRRGALFYVPYLLLTSLPWSALVLPSGFAAARRFRGSPVRTFLAFGFPALFVALSISSSKADEYFLPAAFFFGLAAAEWTSAQERLEQRRAAFLLGHARVVCGLLAAGAALLAARSGGAIPLLGAAAALTLFLVSLRLAPSWRSASVALALVAVAETAVAGALVPSLDRQKSPAPFFSELAPELAGRRVVTDIRDDIHLPLLNWFLDRRVEVLPDERALVAALRGPRPVAAIVLSSSPIASGRFPAENDLRRVQAVEGKRKLVALLNEPAAPR